MARAESILSEEIMEMAEMTSLAQKLFCPAERKEIKEMSIPCMDLNKNNKNTIKEIVLL